MMKISRSMLAGAGLVALSCGSALAQQVTGVLGSPEATTTIDRKTTSAPRTEIRRGDQREGFGINALVAAARRATEGRAQRLAHYDGRCRLRRRRPLLAG